MTPFNHYTIEDHGSDNINTRHRVGIYRKFMGVAYVRGKALDIGTPNYVGESLGVRENTLEVDFNHTFAAPGHNYDVVTCFEVLNHVMNPLQLMVQIHRRLREGGKCYVSVPKLHLISWHHCKHDFAMYDSQRLETLFRYAGFHVRKRETHLPFPWWFLFFGVRPFLRVLFHRISVWELEKPHMITGADA